MDFNQATNDPAAANEFAAEKLRDIFEHFGVEPLEWPAETGAVIAALQSLGYRVDADYLLGVLQAGILNVGMVNGRRTWYPVDVAQAIGFLDTRRRWTLHPMHMHKMTVVEKTQLEAEARGDSAFCDLDRFSVEDLLLLLEESETRSLRHNLRVALTAKLREGGWL